LYTRLLADNNFNVAGTASTEEKAIDEAVRLKPDLILMDIFLRGNMDGIEAAAEIRKTIEVPVIYITGNSDAGTRERAFRTGPSGYLENDLSHLNYFETNIPKLSETMIGMRGKSLKEK